MSTESIAENDYGLCLEDGLFLEDKTIWVASLSNGLIVHQDDGRWSKEHEAWKRLFDYCANEKQNIIGMYLKFRSHVKQMPDGDDVEGYYFSYGAHREFDETITRKYYVCGVSIEGRLNYDWYTTPELIRTRRDSRKIQKEDTIQKRLILKHPTTD